MVGYPMVSDVRRWHVTIRRTGTHYIAKYGVVRHGMACNRLHSSSTQREKPRNQGIVEAFRPQENPGCEPERVSDGSRLALCQTLSIECPSSIFFWPVYFVIPVPFSLSFFVCLCFSFALIGAW